MKYPTDIKSRLKAILLILLVRFINITLELFLLLILIFSTIPMLFSKEIYIKTIKPLNRIRHYERSVITESKDTVVQQ